MFKDKVHQALKSSRITFLSGYVLAIAHFHFRGAFINNDPNSFARDSCEIRETLRKKKCAKIGNDQGPFFPSCKALADQVLNDFAPGGRKGPLSKVIITLHIQEPNNRFFVQACFGWLVYEFWLTFLENLFELVR